MDSPITPPRLLDAGVIGDRVHVADIVPAGYPAPGGAVLGDLPFYATYYWWSILVLVGEH